MWRNLKRECSPFVLCQKLLFPFADSSKRSNLARSSFLSGWEEEQLSGSFSGSGAGIMWQEKDIFKQVCLLHMDNLVSWIWCSWNYLLLSSAVFFFFFYWVVSVFQVRIFICYLVLGIWTQAYTSLPRLGTTWG